MTSSFNGLSKYLDAVLCTKFDGHRPVRLQEAQQINETFGEGSNSFINAVDILFYVRINDRMSQVIVRGRVETEGGPINNETAGRHIKEKRFPLFLASP